MRATGASWKGKPRQQLPSLTWRVANSQWSLGTRPLQVVGAEETAMHEAVGRSSKLVSKFGAESGRRKPHVEEQITGLGVVSYGERT